MNHFDHFLSVQFSGLKFLTLLCSHYHGWPELYSPCKAETLSSITPQCPPKLHQPTLHSVSMSLSILGISNKWNHTILELSCLAWASQAAHWVKNMPAVQQTPEKQVRFLGWEDPLEEGMAAHASILAWRIPWTEEPGGLVHRSQSQTRLKWLSTT